MAASASSSTTVVAEPAKTLKELAVSRVAVDPLVLLDIDRLLAAFEGGGLRTFGSFRLLALSWRAQDFFLTFRAGERVPPKGESVAEYSSLLFEVIVRRAVDPNLTFNWRLGAIYLLLMLHEMQTVRPRAMIPVTESQWAGFERFAGEVRTLRLADGFAAMHALWTGDRFSHRSGSSVNATELDFEYEAEREAQRLPAVLSVKELGTCSWAEQCADALASIEELEAQYDAVRPVLPPPGAAAPPLGAPSLLPQAAAPPRRPRRKISSLLRFELRDYHPGLLPPGEGDDDDDAAADAAADASVAAAAGSVADDNQETFMRRENVRHRPYAPQRARAADGGADRSVSNKAKRRKQAAAGNAVPAAAAAAAATAAATTSSESAATGGGASSETAAAAAAAPPKKKRRRKGHNGAVVGAAGTSADPRGAVPGTVVQAELTEPEPPRAAALPFDPDVVARVEQIKATLAGAAAARARDT